MAESFNKKEREKRKEKRRKEKAERKAQQKLEGKTTSEFMYVDEYGNLTAEKPDPSKRIEIKAEDINLSSSNTYNVEEETERKGTVKFFNEEKGYGFIIDDQTKESLFVHINNLIDKIGERDKVLFEVGSGPKGPIALNVKLQS